MRYLAGMGSIIGVFLFVGLIWYHNSCNYLLFLISNWIIVSTMLWAEILLDEEIKDGDKFD